ncbi:MAG: efflux RND transporter periplasmic adaptor subunit [Gammaproteobacteria bacterium]|nr:efflux RND transporter periplasmic adaptor subunit [Gammaproteobacteria bacterium]
MKKILVRILILSVLGTGVWALIRYETRPKPISAVIAQVEKGTVEATVSNTRAGTIKACRRAGLSPMIGGQIARMHVHKGDHVEADQLLISLWNEDLVGQLALAKEETKAGRSAAEQTCLLAANASRDADRTDQLRKEKQVSAQAAETARAEADAQQAACRAAKARADVALAQQNVASANVDRTLLRAPFAGTVAEINGEEGEFVTPSPTGVATLPAIDLVDTRCLYVSAPIDEVDAPRVKIGMETRVHLDAFGDTVFPGHVRRIAPYIQELEKQARTVEIEVDFEKATDVRQILPGYSADTEIVLAKHGDVLRIPTEAVLEGNAVFVVDPDGLLIRRGFDPGISNWHYTEVQSGLKAGERIVTSIDRKGIAEGAAVTPDTSVQAAMAGK